MIRERRSEDLDRLCAIVRELNLPDAVTAGRDPRQWVDGERAEVSWVYDMAPVHVAPTRNVVGQVQVYRPTRTSSTPGLPVQVQRRADELLAIGRFLVKPQAHDHGIARHLLNQSREYVQRQGKVPVLELLASTYLTREFCEKYGFAAVPTDDPAAAPMIFVE